MSVDHLKLYALTERLHRQFLDVVQAELDRRGYRDINNVRAMIVYNVGDAEMTVSELMWRGCYLGSNVSYNLKKLIESGYLVQNRSLHDKRVVMIKNSPKALDVCRQLRQLNDEHQTDLEKFHIDADSVVACGKTLNDLQKYWSRSLGAIRPSFTADIL